MANLLTNEQLMNEISIRGLTITDKKNEYYIIDDCWKIIKEFIGLNYYGIKYDKIEKLGIKTLQNILYLYPIGIYGLGIHKTHISRDKNCSTNEYKKKMIRQIFVFKHNQQMMKQLSIETNPIDMIKDCKKRGVRVGDEVKQVVINGCGSDGNLGVIIKINKKSIAWSKYSILKITYEGNRRLSWYDKNNLVKPINLKYFSLPSNNEFLEYYGRYIDDYYD